MRQCALRLCEAQRMVSSGCCCRRSRGRAACQTLPLQCSASGTTAHGGRHMTAADELNRLEEMLKQSPLPTAERGWCGAGVIICSEAQPGDAESTYPQFVITPHALGLSWTVEGIRDAFASEPAIDHVQARLLRTLGRCRERLSRARAWGDGHRPLRGRPKRSPGDAR